MARFEQRPGETDEEYALRGQRGYRWGGMLLMVIAIIMWVIAMARPEYRVACTIAGFLWFGLGIAFIKVAARPPA